MEQAPFGIRVVTVQPGGIQSNLGETAKRKTEALLKPESWYWSIRDSIIDRTGTSQINAMPAYLFAKKLVDRLMVNSPGVLIRIGKRSWSLPFMKKFFPVRLLDQLMKNKYGLNKLKLTSGEN